MSEPELAGVQGQNNASESAGQRVQRGYAPWVVLAVWLWIDLVVAIYYRSQYWRPSGTLSLAIYLGFGANTAGLAGWATVWLTLSSDSLGARLAYFVIALGGLLVGIFIGQDGPSEMRELFADFAKLIVGVATPLALMRRRGWKITISEPSSRAYGDAYVAGFQYSIVDLLILTTGIAILVGMLVAEGTARITEDFVVTSLFVFAVVVPSIIAFSLDLRWLVAAICFAPAGIALSLFTLGGHSAVFVLVCGAGACLPVVILALRCFGYRLARGN